MNTNGIWRVELHTNCFLSVVHWGNPYEKTHVGCPAGFGHEMVGSWEKGSTKTAKKQITEILSVNLSRILLLNYDVLIETWGVAPHRSLSINGWEFLDTTSSKNRSLLFVAASLVARYI